MIYAAQYETMNALLGYLTDNCCRGAPEQCAPSGLQAGATKREKVSA